ncbi:MAG TPA: hypothetical protein VKB87_12340 [Myxococcaceae bacterium]|nr:hypothetical protein [Myxococcaceae bacterium]
MATAAVNPTARQRVDINREIIASSSGAYAKPMTKKTAGSHGIIRRCPQAHHPKGAHH